jgi:hypothetical protein
VVAYVRRSNSNRLRHAVSALVVAFLALLVAGRAIDLLPSLNPFATETVDRTGPAVLEAVVELQELKAATANLQVIVDVEQDVNNVPSWLKGQRTVVVAAGTVDATVDLGALTDADVVLSDDRRAVTLTIPRPKLGEARLDMERTQVVARERGIVDRVESALGDAADDQALYVMAEQRLDAAAAADGDLIDRAEASTRATLTTLLHELGFERVKIDFRG